MSTETKAVIGIACLDVALGLLVHMTGAPLIVSAIIMLIIPGFAFLIAAGLLD